MALIEKDTQSNAYWLQRQKDEIATLTSQLTSAKEEIAELTATANSVGKLHIELSKMNLALFAERKETERLRGALQKIAQSEHNEFAQAETLANTAKAALQERQGEDN